MQINNSKPIPYPSISSDTKGTPLIIHFLNKLFNIPFNFRWISSHTHVSIRSSMQQTPECFFFFLENPKAVSFFEFEFAKQLCLSHTNHYRPCQCDCIFRIWMALLLVQNPPNASPETNVWLLSTINWFFHAPNSTYFNRASKTVVNSS